MKAFKETGDPIFKAKAKMSYQSLSNFAKNVPEYVELFGGGKVEAATKPDAGVYWIRDNKLSYDDLEEAKAILFGEISNRPDDKQQLEAQTILNTAFNRMEEYNSRGYKGRKDWTLKEVLQMPNQYQAYNGKQYNKFKKGELEELDKRKVKNIEKIIKQVQDGSFINNVDDSVFYIHEPDGKIKVDDRRLFRADEKKPISSIFDKAGTAVYNKVNKEIKDSKFLSGGEFTKEDRDKVMEMAMNFGPGAVGSIERKVAQAAETKLGTASKALFSEWASKFDNPQEFKKSLDILYEDSWRGDKHPEADRIRGLFKDLYFHGSNAIKEIKSQGFKNRGHWNSGTYFANTPAESFEYMRSARSTGNTQDVIVSDLKGLKIKQLKDIEGVRNVSKGNDGSHELVEKLKRQGYDGIRDSWETLVWNDHKIKDIKTLTDFWEEAKALAKGGKTERTLQ